MEGVQWEEEKAEEPSNSSDFTERVEGGDNQPRLRLDQAVIKKDGNLRKKGRWPLRVGWLF